MRKLFSAGSANVILFTGHFVDVKAMYYLKFGRIPCVAFVSELDVTKSFAHIKANLGNQIVSIYQHSFLDHEKGGLFFNNTVIVLKRRRMVELAGNYCQILHSVRQYAWSHQLLRDLATNYRLAPAPQEVRNVIGFVRSNEMN